MATHLSSLAWRIPWTEETGGYSLWGHKELDTTEQLTHTHTHTHPHTHTHTPHAPKGMMAVDTQKHLQR